MSHRLQRVWNGVRLVLHALSPIAILTILGPPIPWPPTPAWSPVARIVIALLIAAFNVLIAAHGARLRIGGLLFFLAILSSVLRYGDVLIGLRAEWQRWAFGLLLSLPFLLPPRFFETRLHAWRKRRSRR